MPHIRFTNLFATVESALRALTDRHPTLAPLVWAKDGTLNPVMVMFLNDRQLAAAEIGTSVGPGDEIDIVPALEGG
jgi:molybdopterin converting factor small subunit